MENPGIYALYGDNGECLYVGQSRNMRKRVRDHRKTKNFARVEYHPCSLSALCENEHLAINQLHPKLNRMRPKIILRSKKGGVMSMKLMQNVDRWKRPSRFNWKRPSRFNMNGWTPATIIEVVPAGVKPTKAGNWDFSVRNHESYVVRDNTTGEVFWPRVKHLKELRVHLVRGLIEQPPAGDGGQG